MIHGHSYDVSVKILKQSDKTVRSVLFPLPPPHYRYNVLRPARRPPCRNRLKEKQNKNKRQYLYLSFLPFFSSFPGFGFAIGFGATS